MIINDIASDGAPNELDEMDLRALQRQLVSHSTSELAFTEGFPHSPVAGTGSLSWD